MQLKLNRGQQVRLINGGTKGTVVARANIDGHRAYLVQWGNGNAPSFERRCDLVEA